MPASRRPPARAPLGRAAALLLLLALVPQARNARAGGSSAAAERLLAGPSLADGVLPMGVELVPEDARDQLPMPLGLSMNYAHINEDLDAKKLRVAVGGVAVPKDAVSFDRLTQATDVFMARADAWVLPFLDLYGLAGYLQGTAEHIQVSFNGAPLPPFAVNYYGPVLGAGFALAGAYGPWFGVFDLNYTATDVNVLTSTVSTLTIDPRIGLRGRLLGLPISGYVGAMYEGIQGTQSGSAVHDGLALSFDVQVRAQEAWNTLVGVQLELAPRWSLIAEGGVGERDQTLFSLRCGL